MTTYIPDLADEVLVTRGPHAGGVGTITDIDDDRGFFVEGIRPDGADFTRWITVPDITPAEWGTWRIEITTGANPRTLLRTDDITDRPVEPVEMILEGMRGAPWFVVDAAHAREVAIRTAHIVSIEVVVTARRDHR